MKVIKNNDALKGANSGKCKYLEYFFDDNDIDLSVATITGRYPDNGYCVNLRSKELIYCLEGNGTLNFENKTVSLKKGDSILIYPNEKYFWETNYCIVSMVCTPAWTEEQHKLIK